ncbi:hypothetical protein J4462_03755 [Candidatus Pacearchaeota archaeon]|nr:hypothetical protein [Candidatus Pacearchaeota archaeon]
MKTISENDSDDILKNEYRLVLGLIEKNNPTTLYKLAKLVDFSYTKLLIILRKLDGQFIDTRVEINSNNRAERRIFLK